MGAGRDTYRWRICALLFFATTINYIDRQVLGVLAPYLQPIIGWNEIQYGYIVTSFQAAYAIGLLIVGGVIDRFGARIGYAIAISIWSLAAMSHALVQSVIGFAVARFALGLGESGELSGSNQDRGRMVPAQGARAGHRHLQFGIERGRHCRAACRSLDHAAARLALGVRVHGVLQRGLADRVARDLSSRDGARTERC